MSKEVSCRAVECYLWATEEKKIPQLVWGKEIPYDEKFLRNSNERIEWSVFCKLIENIRPYLSEEDFIEMGRSWTINHTKGISVYSFIPKIIIKKKGLLYVMQNHFEKMGSQFFTCIDYNTKQVKMMNVKHTLKLKSNFQFCREFFLIALGTMEMFFSRLGTSPKINLTWIEKGAIFDINCSLSGGFLHNIRKAFSRLFLTKEFTRELEELNNSLLKRYKELEKTQIVLQQQTKQLKTAFNINETIRKNLDLDAILKAIVRSIVEEAEYSAAMIKISTKSENKPIERNVKFGNSELDVKPIKANIIFESQKIGNIKAWPKPIIELDKARELLNQIIPTISLAIHDALTYNTLLDYRNNLEIKVQERTLQLRRTQETLEQTVQLLKNAQTARERFFTNISHEFRTPLTLIMGPAQELMQAINGVKLRENANLIYRNANRLNRLVSQLLDLSKIEAGEMGLNTKQIDLISFTKDIIHSFTSLSEKKNITLKFCSPLKKLNIYLDVDKVEKIIVNLLSNAFKFTPQKGKISVEIDRNESHVQIKISDTGIGIPKERQQLIFDRFFQVNGTITRDHEGTGIGLALTKELVELHKGNILVKSTEGEGSKFIVSLPLLDLDVELNQNNNHLISEACLENIKSPVQKQYIYSEIITDNNETNNFSDLDLSDTINSNGEKPVLLLIEDSVDVRNFIIGFLETEYRILEASNGENGFNKAVEFSPDLIVSDIMMPIVDGFKLCKLIKEDERTSHIPLILLTAKATTDDKIEGLYTGADDYIMKPFQAEELKARIRNLITQRSKLRAQFNKGSIFNIDDKSLTSIDRKFLERTNKIIINNLPNPLFSVESLSKELAIGRTTLHKKMVAIVGHSPSEIIKRIRLSKASILLKENTGNISEIALEVGFNNPAYFSECFKKQFGVSPSQYNQ